MNTKVTVDKVPAVLKQIQEMVAMKLLIGIPAENGGRQGDAGVISAHARGEEVATPLNNAAIGYIQETGSPVNNIPARPFLVPGVAAIQDKAIARLKTGASQALDGDAFAAGRALATVGLMAQSSVRNTINAGVGPALAPSTLAARRRRGRTGTVPLIDTGQLRNAITYVLRRER
jgi:hypothetical protein